MSYFLHFPEGKLHYQKWGDGQKVLLAFHGYGQVGEVMKPLAEAWAGNYTVYSFDLFYHGKSTLNIRRSPLKKEEWIRLIKRFLEKESIEMFSVLGFSMGGRFALSVVEHFAQRVEQLYLLAADGVKINFWYHLATSYKPIRRQMLRTIDKPAAFRSMVNAAYRFNLAPKRAVKFAESQMGRKSQRFRVYASWVKFREFRFEMRLIAKRIKENNIQLLIVLGRFDQIIDKEAMSYLTKYFSSNEYQITILNCGHADVLPYLARFLKGDKKALAPE